MNDDYLSALQVKIEVLESKFTKHEAENTKQHKFLHELIVEVYDRVFKSNGKQALTAETADLNKRFDEMFEMVQVIARSSGITQEEAPMIPNLPISVKKGKKSLKALVSIVIGGIIMLAEAIRQIWLLISHANTQP